MPGWKSANPAARKFLLVSALFVASTALAMLTPGIFFPHYLLLLLQPTSLVAACILGIWGASRQPVVWARYTGVLFGVCMLGIPLAGVIPAVRDAGKLYQLRKSVGSTPAREIVREIKSISPDAKRMAVWGWMPSLYVQTGIPPATRHAICHFLIEPSPARAHLRASFLADIRREKPELIIDAVAAGCFCWSGWDSTKRLHSFPELDAYVKQNYLLVSEKNVGDEDDPVRFYVSREYLLSKGKSVPPPGGARLPVIPQRTRDGSD